MSPDISGGEDRQVCFLVPALVRERVLGGGIVLSALLWLAVVVVACISSADSPAVMCLIAAASTVSLFCALLIVGYGTRRIIVTELNQLTAQVEQLNAKFNDREAAWTAISKLTDGAVNGGTLTSLRRHQ